MSTLGIAKRWTKRWSKIFTEATNKKISFYLSPRRVGKYYFIIERLKRPHAIKRLKAFNRSQKSHLTCSRKHIKRRGVLKCHS